MPYVVTPGVVRYPQLSFDDILDMPQGARALTPVGHKGDTRTFYQEYVPRTTSSETMISNAICALVDFNKRWEKLRAAPRETLYHHFTIPKRNGKPRPIDAPNEELMLALRELKGIFELNFCALHHTSAFAYVKGRSALDAVRRHQTNDSRWLLKTDLSGFFPSTTFEFAWKMLSDIYPFNEVIKRRVGKEALETALELCFLNGGLPQGTPISPMLTNIIMIPIDHELSNAFRDFDGNRLIYTRYADDMDISCRVNFNFQNVVAKIRETFKKFGAPYVLKPEKMHYGSRSGRNWILGVMYNKDGNITLGYRRKNATRAQIANYLRARGTDNAFEYGELLSLNGTLAYFKKVEPAYTAGMLDHYEQKYHINVIGALRYDIKNY